MLLLIYLSTKFMSNVQAIIHAVYRQYGVLVNNDDSQDAESHWTTVQTAQKHIYLRKCN